MALFSTSFNSTFTSEFLLPPALQHSRPSKESASDVPDSQSQSQSQVTTNQEHALKTLLAILHDHAAFISDHPYVTKVCEIETSAPHALDVAEWKDLYSDTYSTTDNPLYQSSPQVWHHYEIVDAIPLPFGYKHYLTYYSTLLRTQDGFEAFTDPGSGVKMYARWTVWADPREEGRFLVREYAEIRCSWFLAWYIKGSYERSHKDMHDRLKRRWEGVLLSGGKEEPLEERAGIVEEE